MKNTSIQVEDLSKIYQIRVAGEKYKTLRESLINILTNTVNHIKRWEKEKQIKLETIWALKDVSFEIDRGEIVGVIGPNGAGKSTLLKILSHITEPTEGRAIIRGRVGSLLEVGTGFHFELTGRENVYLNGAILGMKKSEIDRKFDEIVSFAEVDKFIDTPIKYYSSGMNLRLAFAVAAHLETEILLVDEVLAVGDAAFQKRCLNKMKDVRQEGRTVLFVSHNMPAIKTLCSRAILLEKGAIQYQGNTSSVIGRYLGHQDFIPCQKIWLGEHRPGNNVFRLNSVTLKNPSGNNMSIFNISEEILVEIDYEIIRESCLPRFSLTLFDSEGYCAFSSHNNTDLYYTSSKMLPGRYRSICIIYSNLLNEGRYHISIAGASAYWSDNFYVDNVISFEVLDDGVFKGDYPGRFGGIVRPKLMWKTVPIPFNYCDECGKSGLKQ